MLDPARKYFHCTDRERAIFEAGIKLGGIFHQYIGVPVNEGNIKEISRAIEKSVSVQPFVKHVSVEINLGGQSTSFQYTSLSGEMMDVRLTVEYNGQVVRAGMHYVQDLNYPLMYLEE
ncbi:MAG: dihydroneopterin aldolase family protein [Ferroplasma sp.]|uniref:dihydroneopterin aldolase family protein n=1 Tax=Ferroplasma sp. TaxID=2591003 RepID=UPI0028149C14|nr:dihydroneopterin aldolase family protein [Ferroplasma sp.]WMT51102.1 MAG: dihydroneopterin aldolase family protein [Ferroplasma sp.]